ncbi:tetratricopeptide repeat protein [Pantanalinema sp. GBBB05]|uniref:tetratricopeptide repeat protein n=1 Tax=Pantanalinema sp. GBBB05 TaxID=2604139 RepID=UPI001D23BADC|nr:tetratricopeptide repeat protein [Pantanalinema sp. GBBB05]
MNDSLITALLEDLKHPDEIVRDRATQELWRLWFGQKGVVGLDALRRAQMLLEAGNTNEAELLLTDLVDHQPDFAEAWNRRAVLYYAQGYYRQAIKDCEQVLQLNPIHFGALHGLGLCHMALGNYRSAIRAFRKALDVQPYALVNQRFILECTIKL